MAETVSPIHIESLVVGPIESNCYIVHNDRREALIVDPGDDADRILSAIERIGVQVHAYLLTHGHIDHVSALAEVRERHPAPIGLHPEDARWAFQPVNQLPPFYSAPRSPGSIERAWEDGAEWTDAEFPYRIMETPGHTPGGVSLYFFEHGVLFSGDTLFQGSVGRTDLPGGDPAVLSGSLRKLAQLPNDTRVYPGHGPMTTIGFEKENNPFLRPGMLK